MLSNCQGPDAYVRDLGAIPKVDVDEARAAFCQGPNAHVRGLGATTQVDVCEARAALCQGPDAHGGDLGATTQVDVGEAKAAARVNKSSFAMSSRMMRQRLGNRLAPCTAKRPLALAMQSIVVTDGGRRSCKLQQVVIVLTTAFVGSQDTA